MISGLGGWHFVILLAVVVLLFGAKKLPEAARSLGQSARVFKGEMKGLREDELPVPGDTGDGHPGATAPTATGELPATAEPSAAASGASDTEGFSAPSSEMTRARAAGQAGDSPSMTEHFGVRPTRDV